MGKVANILLLCAIMVVAATTPVAKGVEEGPEAVQNWFRTLPRRAPKLTHLEFYFQDRVSGENPTARMVVKGKGTSLAPFGSIVAIDDVLTVGPEVNSTVLGRAQGMYTFSQLDGLVIELSTTLVFTNAEYNGSTLSILGRNAVLDKYREMPVLGGTGVFRLARGIATAKTHSLDLTTGDATVHYDIHVLHF